MGMTYAVADLHGRFDLFTKAIDAIATRGGGKVVFMGDYVDRGLESRQILEALMGGPPAGQSWTILKGNHEDMMVQVCRRRAPVKWWVGNGGAVTLISYGHKTGESVLVDLAVVPTEHLAWLDRLPALHADDYRIYVHASVDPTIPLEHQRVRDLLWRTYPDGFQDGFFGRHVVHGHEPHVGPVLCHGRTNLDTQAWQTGRLVVGVFDDEQPGGPVDLIEILGPTYGDLVSGAS